MDFMFEDEVDEVGSDVEAYCPKCKADTTHVVISKYEDEIRRVQCNPCGDVHSYRKPRGEVDDDMPEPVAARRRAALKKLTWEEFFAKHGEKPAKPYEFRELYKENIILDHPKFGKGFVSEVVSDSKVEITFKDARRVLVHNRKNIPGTPLAAEGDGMPTPPPAPKPEKTERAEKPRSNGARENGVSGKPHVVAKAAELAAELNGTVVEIKTPERAVEKSAEKPAKTSKGKADARADGKHEGKPDGKPDAKTDIHSVEAKPTRDVADVPQKAAAKSGEKAGDKPGDKSGDKSAKGSAKSEKAAETKKAGKPSGEKATRAKAKPAKAAAKASKPASKGKSAAKKKR